MADRFLNESRRYLAALGLPDGDQVAGASQGRFEDGAAFRLEIATVNSGESLEALLDTASSLDVLVNRVTETKGVFLHSDDEIRRYVKLAGDYGCELVMSPGPRAKYDTSASRSTTEGATIGYRLRGQEQVVRAVEDVRRAVALGVTGFVVYDEGLLWVLGELRAREEEFAGLRLKVSAHCGHGNPAACKVLERLGADSINPVRDLSMPMLRAIRSAVAIPMDCHTDTPPSSGGFVRFYEAPEMVRALAPVYLKTGNSVLSGHGVDVGARAGEQMARRASLVRDMVCRHYPEAVQSQRVDAI